LAWLSIIAFGGITIYSSENWTTLIDDFVYRLNMPWLARPVFAAPFWAIISCAWILLIAGGAREFWTDRIPGYEFTEADSIWFGYITALTGMPVNH
jgi:hypothetical protein